MVKNDYKVEFIRALEAEIHKISPSISLQDSKMDPLSQILEIVRIATTTLLQEKQNIENEYFKLRNLNPISSVAELSDLVRSKNSLSKASEKLAYYEKLLTEKEQKLKNDESENKIFLQGFAEERGKFLEEREDVMKREKEMKEKIEDINTIRNRLIKERELFQLEKEKFWEEHRDIKSLKNKLENNIKETEKLHQVSRVQNENYIVQIEKIEKERRGLQEKSDQLKLKEKELESLKQNLITEQVLVKKDSARIDRERTELEKLLKSIIQERRAMQSELETVTRTKRRIDSQEVNSDALYLLNDSPEPLDLPLLYEKLKEQIEIYNSELSVRELKIYQSQENLKKDKEKLGISMQQSEKIFTSLEVSKLQILTFYKEIIPELEQIYMKNQLLMGNLQQEFSKIEELHRKMTDDIFTVAEVKNQDVTFMDFKDAVFETGKKADSNETIGNRSKSVADKLRALGVKEKELELMIQEQEEKAIEMANLKAQVEIARNELEDEREKIKIQEFRIEKQIKSLEMKECELKFLNQELNKKANLLNIKENQLELRRLQMRDTKYAQPARK